MAERVADGDDIFVYTGGRVPPNLSRTITHARIDESVKEIDVRAFFNCRRLRFVEIHEGVTKIGKQSFKRCPSLRRIKLPGVRIIDMEAFNNCKIGRAHV